MCRGAAAALLGAMPELRAGPCAEEFLCLWPRSSP
ncbi:hypothetical protein RLOC_00005271 [Lonchura striata]|uniref:Uncharacterized protein n=1 Tax=Lonchura striata TaxID=40157 RepID=A0A218VE02_9PASE|nr:hypothetical protein RLOC_00005271 [Lonchura striata domestica]